MINGNHIELSILCGLCILEKPTEHYLISHSVISKEVIIWRFYLHDDSHVQQYYFDSRLWRLFHEGDRKILDIKCIKGLVLYFILLFKCIVFWMNWMWYIDQEFLIFILWVKSTQKWIWKYIEIIHIWQYRSWLTFQGLH